MTAVSVRTGTYIFPYPPMTGVRAAALLIRLGRLDSLFVYDHVQEFYPACLWDGDFTWLHKHQPSPHELYDYQTLLSGLASKVGRMHLGVGVTESVRRHPVMIAQAALTLAHVAKRAPIIGFGAGEILNLEPYGLPTEYRVARAAEALEIMRLCVTSHGPIDFDGKYFRLHRAVLGLRPPPGRIPQIWVAAHGPRMLELTGRYGDGWLPWSIVLSDPEQYADKLAQIRSAAVHAGRDPDGITASLMAQIFVASSERKARALLNSKIARYWALMFPAARWQQLGAEHPFGSAFRGFGDVLPESYDRATLESALAAVPPEVVESGNLVGTPEQIIRRLRLFRDAGMRHVALAPMSSYVTRRDFAYTAWALQRIARSLRR
ncbi:LLM class flavin-dependent oxidoreductase [Nocardia aurantiaca]|uniref:LLM class flavin-dependent oxidoreductase n=1 Tax=Nocardia aurantiaca TaxID=2675850 RepID=A0A6I3L6T0_9NOCA|nr:LLM class flavin-dependent oxidoreductase [Nocardia aurantiaca]MTE16670.1 LLM class flavin-dependent oxidoreductase [Nocardia aurantiaca]